MRIISERTEIATAINGHKMPVIVIDLADSDDYGLKSKPVLIDNGKFKGEDFPYYIKAHVRAYKGDSKFVFSGEVVCVSSDFGYDKMATMLKFRNAPIVKADQDVIISVIDSEHKLAFKPIVLHTSGRIVPFCTQPLSFVDDDYSTAVYFMEQYP